MRLLHLSDIHFQAPVCNTALDPDKPFRTMLEQDLTALCSDGVPVDAVLVGGDIAYKASVDEYEAAKQWLLKIADLCGCPTSRIFTVPGNHDVDWATCKKVLVANAQEAIARAADFHARDHALMAQLQDEAAAKLLFEPLDAYNTFAAQFQCNVFGTKPFWEHDLDLGHDVVLRIRGMTSTFVSGAGGRDAKAGSMYLGAAQTAIDPDRNVVALALAHHPPNWLSDSKEASKIIDARAKLQFFGHEHDQRCVREVSYMRFLAGAVNPERDGADWAPGYNLVDLQIVGAGSDRKLDIKGHLRRFQPAPNETFVPLFTAKGEAVWKHEIELPAPHRASFAAPSAPRLGADALREPPHAIAKLSGAIHAAVEAQSGPCNPLPVDAPLEARMAEPSTENLYFRFWQLRADEMLEIATTLGLVTDKDLDLPPHRRYDNVMRAAKERGLITEFAKQIEQREKRS